MLTSTNVLRTRTSAISGSVLTKKGNIIVYAQKGICLRSEEVCLIKKSISSNSFNSFNFVLLEECVDMRRDLCFLDYSSWRCSQPMSQNQTKKVCCCSMGKAWGQPCEPCPLAGTSRYKFQSIELSSKVSVLLFCMFTAFV